MSTPTSVRGRVVAEGKTKIVTDIGAGLAEVLSKDDITAGDGAKHDVFSGKAIYSTETTCNVFALLKACGIPVAFKGRTGPDAFTAELCDMWPYEVVIRREVAKGGSYQKRNPDVKPGTVFTSLVVEFYLKTSGKNFHGIPLQKDDPLIVSRTAEGLVVVRPDMERGATGNEEIHIPAELVYGEDWERAFSFMETVALQVFGVLEAAWKLQGCRLLDLKIECGDYMVADVIDNDSWRLRDSKDEVLDKQRYRDNDKLADVQARYEEVAQRSRAFASLSYNTAFVSHTKRTLSL